MKKDPLSVLVANNEVDRQKMIDILKNLVEINPAGGILLKQGFSLLNSANKIQVLLVASKAVSLLKLSEKEGMSPSVLAVLSGLPSGTVKPTVKRLKEDHKIVGVEGVYSIPNHGIEDLWRAIVKNNEKK